MATGKINAVVGNATTDIVSHGNITSGQSVINLIRNAFGSGYAYGVFNFTCTGTLPTDIPATINGVSTSTYGTGTVTIGGYYHILHYVGTDNREITGIKTYVSDSWTLTSLAERFGNNNLIFESHTAADTPSTYKDGITFSTATASTDFPATYANVITFRQSSVNRTSQLCVQYTGATYIRGADGNVWGAWSSLNAITNDPTFTSIKKQGRVCAGSISFYASSTSGNVGTLDSAFKPAVFVRGVCRTDDISKWGKIDINPATGVMNYQVPTSGLNYYAQISYISAT